MSTQTDRSPSEGADDNVIALPILGDWISTESTVDPDTGERSDPFETVRPAPPK